MKFKEKRAITLEEHQRIIAAEVNPERKTLYQLCWHLGASQGDIASLKGEDVDWTNNTVGFTRKKSGVPVLVHLGADALNVFKDLPAEGVLFPYLAELGFHWNNARKAWQHPCGTAPVEAATYDPRRRYGSYFAADVKPS